MVKLETHWRSNRAWFHYEGWKRVLNNDAPEEAKRSYRVYLQQLLDIDRRTDRLLVVPKNQESVDEYEDHDADWSLGSFETESSDPLIAHGQSEFTAVDLVVCQSDTAREGVDVLLSLIDTYGSSEANNAIRCRLRHFPMPDNRSMKSDGIATKQ